MNVHGKSFYTRRIGLVPVVMALQASLPARGDDSGKSGIEFFEKKIRPVLAEHCYTCHSRGAPAAGRLSRASFARPSRNSLTFNPQIYDQNGCAEEAWPLHSGNGDDLPGAYAP